MKNGGDAFPCYTGKDTAERGMTFRDYLAGQALAGVMPFCTFDEIFNKPEKIARATYKIADAVLAERG
jgi:hypothetical protein